MKIPNTNRFEDGEELVLIGDAVKATGNTVVGRLVRFTDEDELDLTGDFFTIKTFYGFDPGETRTIPLFYSHGRDPAIKGTAIGQAEIGIDDVGVWIKGQIALREKYLDRYGPAIKQLASKGLLGFSSGAVAHLAFGKSVGEAWHWDQWIIGEGSLTPIPADFANQATTERVVAAKSIVCTPLDDVLKRHSDASGDAPDNSVDVNVNIKVTGDEPTAEKKMDNETNTQDTSKLDDILSAVKAFDERLEALETKPDNKAEKGITGAGSKPAVELNSPALHLDADTRKYDNYSVGDLSFAAEMLDSSFRKGIVQGGSRAQHASDGLYKAMSRRLMEDSQEKHLTHARSGLAKMLATKGIKGDEVMYSTLSGYGDDWVGVAYSSELWQRVYNEAAAISMLRAIEFPAGAESMVIPIDSSSPTWYKVAQADDMGSNPGGKVTPKVTASQMGTSNVTMTLSKFGARVYYSGELVEDAVLPFVSVLRNDITRSGVEYLDSAIMDGDTAAGASANINDIAGTPAATDYFLNFNGFRKSALVTTTANSTDIGTLSAASFLTVAQLLGTNGIVGRDKRQNVFFIDNATHYKAIQLPEVKTKDVFTGATIEGGMLTGLWGYPIKVADNLCHQGSGLANTSGKIDVDTPSNNTTGTVLFVRKDKWMFAWRRRATIETTREPSSDSTEIVSLMRAGLIQRDTEASAVGYDVTV